jgi:hypothetical protein
VPVKTAILVGAQNCPLWEPNDSTWNSVLKHPERMPALGVYDQGNPEVADWETKWAVEHGIGFFVYCWYRASRGDAVEMKYSSVIDALKKSRYVGRFKFAIMWENQPRDAATWGESGVTDERDLMENLMPFWMKNYFKHPSYLKIDNKPLLFIYDAHRLVYQLGGPENVPQAFEKMRQACTREGFAGLYLLSEYRGLDPKELKFRKDMGFDYVFPYVWPVGEPWRAVEMQVDYMRKAQEEDIIPWVLAVSQGWSGWNDKPAKYLYTLSPRDYEGLLRKARKIIATRPPGELGGRILLLDNWNEWGEGHYIAPHRQYGFGYLDAVRRVFSNAPEKHVDLLPEDLGLGPYDSACKNRTR